MTHPLSSTDISIFYQNLTILVISRNTDKKLHFGTFFLILLIVINSLWVVLINMIAILMMLVKLATPRLPEIRLFWKKSYDVIVFLCDVTNKILSRGSCCIVDMVMRTKFGSSSISTTSFLWGLFNQKNQFFKRYFWFKRIDLKLVWSWIFTKVQQKDGN